MRYNCDWLRDIRAERLAKKMVRRAKWRRKFAFWPVKVYRGLCVWLEWYEIRAETQWANGHSTTYRYIAGNCDASQVATFAIYNRTGITIDWTRRVIEK